jgi:hypothetical protein
MFVPVPDDYSISTALGFVRTWLDHENLTPCSFKITATDDIGFELGFSNDRDAVVFERFKWRPVRIDVKGRVVRASPVGRVL